MIIKVKKSNLVCPMSLTLKDQTGMPYRTLECTLPRRHEGRCCDGQGSYWQMPDKFRAKLEKLLEEEARAGKHQA
jgi:hypothetical protein